MTITGFAKKYNVPISYATLASHSVKPVATLERDKDFPEHDMWISLLNVITRKMKRAETNFKYHQVMYRRVRNTYGK